jgi:hypothetical protein
MLKLRSTVIMGAAALGLTAIGGPAQAIIAPDALITITQVGNTIVATGSGFIDLAGLTPFSGGILPVQR